jgi:hypothetical protein
VIEATARPRWARHLSLYGRRARPWAAALAGLGVVAAAAGAPAQASVTLGDHALATQAILAWNAKSLSATALAPLNPPLEARNIAIESAAVYDAVTSITGRFAPYAVRLNTSRLNNSRPASIAAAANAAAYTVMSSLYPDQQSSLDAFETTQLAAIPDGPAKTNGQAIGGAAAVAILALRASDHAGDSVPYTPGTDAGEWQPTPTAFKPALDPGWGAVTPFALRTGSQFRPGPPPALTSAAYTRDFTEIKTIGSAASTTRTGDQTTIAALWTATGPQLWNQAVQHIAEARHLGPAVTARDFAMLALAGADAFIAGWDAKYTYNQWRPVTAIQRADTDGNSATTADPAWMPIITTPNFPDYVAGHATYAGAAETVLTALFGTHPGKFTFTNHANGLSWTYTNFNAVGTQVVNARVWGGIHFRTSCTTGRSLGDKIGAYALNHLLKPAR